MWLLINNFCSTCPLNVSDAFPIQSYRYQLHLCSALPSVTFSRLLFPSVTLRLYPLVSTSLSILVVAWRATAISFICYLFVGGWGSLVFPAQPRESGLRLRSLHGALGVVVLGFLRFFISVRGVDVVLRRRGAEPC